MRLGQESAEAVFKYSHTSDLGQTRHAWLANVPF